MALEVLVVSLENATCQLFNLGAVVEFGVAPAHTVLDGSVIEDALLDVRVGGVTEWSEERCCSIDINTSLLFGEVWLWACNLLAWFLIGSGAIVESVQPVSAVVGGKSPLSEPDVELDVLGLERLSFVRVTSLGNGEVVIWDAIECLVVVVVHDDVFSVPVFEEIIPDGGIISERVMEDEFGLRSIFLDLLSNLSIEVLEDVEVCEPPWLVDWFEGIESAVSTISFKEIESHVETSLDVGVVNVLIVSTLIVSNFGLIIPIEISEPTGSCVTPVAEEGLILPNEEIGLTRVVKAVLRSLGSMDVNEDLDVVFGTGIEDPLNLVSGAIHAADIRSVWVESPVTDRHSDNFDATS